MDCREAGKLVNAYIDGSISDAELEQFIAHVRSCPSCMEELETYFTVDYALQALNDEQELFSYDIRQILIDDLEERELSLRSRRRNRRLFYSAVALVEALMLLVILFRYLPGSELSMLDQIRALFNLLP